MNRRRALKLLGAAAGTAATACTSKVTDARASKEKAMTKSSQPQPGEGRSPILRVQPLGFPWPTPDPFLFCVHHDDRYPAGNERQGPVASLEGRQLGQDFEGKDGWRMYHGQVVPGFPQHPHRGFETVTVVRRGLLDHSDSLGASARYGGGDVQWLTAGSGVLHSEMFPLVHKERDNPVELFQIWLNLPRADKFAEPRFSMLWNEAVPRHVARDEQGRPTEVTVVAGSLAGLTPPPPPPRSWASRPESAIAIWTVKLAPQARWTLPASVAGVNRWLYFFRGEGLRLSGQALPARHLAELRAEDAVLLENGAAETELLLLQGRPIGEPVVQHGPFVMTSREEIVQAFADYRRTGFGGWPWPSDDPVHPREEGRFARFADGKLERPT